MKPLRSIEDLYHLLASYRDNSSALNSLGGEGLRSVSRKAMLKAIRHLALGLSSCGFQRHSSVAIFSSPSPEWVIADLAIMAAGGVTVPLFANISDENCLFELENSKATIIFVSGEEQWRLLNRNHLKFDLTIAMDNVNGGHSCLSWNELMSRGAEAETVDPDAFGSLMGKIDSADLATIIYTSGSTGLPKGVEITHRALLSLIHLENFRWDPESDSYLSLLPLAHTFGRTLNLFMIAWGVPVYYLNDIANLSVHCRELHPTIIVVVPRLLEKVYAKMAANVELAGYMKRTLGQWAFELAHQEDYSIYKSLMHPLADTIVYSSLREALGGKLRVVITGGAHLNPHLCHFFIDIGVPIFEGWGLTEASTACCNDLQCRKIGTVGKPLSGVEVKVTDEGELCIKGDLLMRGYHKDPEATAEVLDSDGWLHTGDKGRVDDDGYVTIFGRIKEMYKTSTGEYIVPVPIEQELCKAALIDMALVVGEDRKFASCLLFPNLEVLHSLKSLHNASSISNEEFLDSEYVREEMKKLLHQVNSRLNPWEQLQGYHFVLEPLTVESGELTPSMKIRREVVAKKFNSVIDEMYN